jgi:hypothetical protein
MRIGVPKPASKDRGTRVAVTGDPPGRPQAAAMTVRDERPGQVTGMQEVSGSSPLSSTWSTI